MEIITFSKYFIENAAHLSRKTGYEVVYKLEAGKHYIVFSAHDAADQLLEFQKLYHTHYTIYQSENVESRCFTPAYIELMKSNAVLQYSPYTATVCKEWLGIETAGFFNFDYPKLKSTSKRTIDLLFFGCMTQKRHDMLNEIQNQCSIQMVIATDLFHAELEDALLRSRFVLNISVYENSVLETHRINKALACGCKVISNYSVDTKMNDKYKDLVFFCGRTVGDYIEEIKKRV
jgi:hypothetical protein